jgi:hypothetical protein
MNIHKKEKTMSDTQPIPSKTGHYRVDYEYAKLREAVLGGTDVRLPHKGTIFDKYITDLFPDEETREFLRAIQEAPFSEAHPDDHQRMVDETNELAAILEKHGVIVHHAEPYTEETLRLLGRGGYNNGWAKDAFETVGEYFFDLAHKNTCIDTSIRQSESSCKERSMKTARCSFCLSLNLFPPILTRDMAPDLSLRAETPWFCPARRC